MAKISPVSIKYLVKGKFEAEGAVEKPDVIGALFGQTEGLLGSELEMRELQKEGKIGRIEVNLEGQNGKTVGEIEIPSALDKTETTLIAAAIETIERIGPSDAKITIEKIEDIRGNKRDYIIERAKKLLADIEQSVPETKEIEENLKVSSRMTKLKAYGKDKLPAGNIEEAEELLVVEGRADVVNLIKNGISNVIAMNGTILPETVKELSYEKETALFLDGDRGGQLIAKNAIENARIDFVAFAPDGKEVEELSKKEILVALRKKIPVQEFFSKSSYGRGRRTYERRTRRDYSSERRTIPEKSEKIETEEGEVKIDEKQINKLFKDITGSRSALFLDRDMEVIKKVPARSIVSNLGRTRKKVATIIIDGTATQPVIKAAEESGIKNIVAKNFSYTETSINLVSL